MPRMLFLAVLSSFVFKVFAVDINLLLLFSLTRFEGNSEIADPFNTAAYLASAALIEHFNAGGESVVQSAPICELNIDYTLVNTKSDFSTTLAALGELDLNTFDAIIGPSRSTTCVPVSFATLPFNLPVLSPTCTTPELDDDSYTNIVRTIASDETTAKALVSLLTKLPSERPPILAEGSAPSLQTYSKVVVFYQDDAYGSKYKDSLFANRDDIEFIFFPFQAGSSFSIDKTIVAASATKINVFIALLDLESLAALLTKAFELNLLGPNRLWLFTERVFGANEILSNLGARDPEIITALSNSLLVQATGRTDQPEEDDFDSQFLDPNFGYIDEVFDKLEAASDSFDFEAVFDEFEEPDYQNGDFALFAYDTVLALAKFVDATVDEQCNDNFDSSRVVEILKSDAFSFQGVTGLVEYDEETGARSPGTSDIKLVNLRFSDDEGEDVVVGRFRNDDWEIFDNLLFNGNSQTPPILVDPPAGFTRIEVSDRIKAGIFAFAALIFFLVALLFTFIQQNRNKKVIKATQPVFLNIMLLGIIISTISVYILAGNGTDLEDGQMESNLGCNLPFFLVSIGSTITIAAMVMKLHRVYDIANISPELRDFIVSFRYYISLIILIVFIDIMLLVIVFTQNPLILKSKAAERDEFGQPLKLLDICVPDSNDKIGIYAILLVFHIILYIYGFRLVVKTQNLSHDYQEGKFLAAAIMAQFELSLLGIPIVSAVGENEVGIRYLVVSLMVLFSNLILLVLIFAPKIYKVFIGNDDLVWSDKNDINGNLSRYSTRRPLSNSREYPSDRQDSAHSRVSNRTTQEFANEVTL